MATHQFKISGPQLALTFVAPVGTTRIGRQPDNDLVFVHPLVSRYHARLTCTEETCQLTDLGSTHGTTVNRERIAAQTPVLLKQGDVVEIGAFRMEYELISTQPTMSDTPEVEEPMGEPPAAEPVRATVATPPQATAVPTSTQSQLDGWDTTEFTPITFTPRMPPPPPPTANGRFELPPGLSFNDSSYLRYLPDIYYLNGTDFIARFLALLESILAPIEWNVDHFYLYLDPKTSPASFLPWLANWYEIIFDDSWSLESQRQLLVEAHDIYRRRGTGWALQRVLEIYTGVRPQIDDKNRNLEPFTFTVRLPLSEREVNRTMLEHIINISKPAHTTYTLILNA
ncbi:MAG: phage tail protein I [Ardenticatenaceae bacterium]|nr:phage tail protein I [Ardenticatenaceae bacterium]